MVIGLDCADREVVFGPRGQISPTSSKYSTSLIAGFSSLLPAVEWNGGLGQNPQSGQSTRRCRGQSIQGPMAQVV